MVASPPASCSAPAFTKEEFVSEVQDLAERWLGALHALDIPAAVELLADGAVLEMPLAPPGLPNRFEGKAAIRAFLSGSQLFSKLEFHDVEVHATSDPELAVVEFRSTGTFEATGLEYANRYALIVRARAGRIVLYREYFNPLALAGAFER
jgi:ketosteroid isomerase-like protein